MDEHTLRVLEYYKVRDLMAEHAASEPGRAEAGSILPSADAKAVERSLKETDELRRYLEASRDFPIHGLNDIASALKKAAVEGAALRPEELLDVLSVARASRLIKAALYKARQEFALLAERAAGLGVFETLEFEISRAIGEEGEVLDAASFELKRIRRGLGQVRARINKELEEILQSPAYSKAVQEPIITVRGDRYVLPLKPNFKLYISGIVHDQSASRSTVFVEPEKTVELNNKLAQLRMDERREVERILAELTASVRGHVEALEGTFAALVAFDVLYAKATYAVAIGGAKPAVVQGGVVDLHEARHPLLIKAKGDKTVPLDIRLGREYASLVITGPNTGGKTVVLKTAGLLCLMAQAGMLVPAGPDSAISVFKEILSDIGDEQSLEQSLSTFSSHMSQIVRILAKADRESFVLLDELGAGTDPVEGSALAASILRELHARGTRVVVTTHHGALKVFAANTPGVMNASVEFDPVDLQPTYRLLIGRPGRSNALLVAERLGMPRGIVQAAAETKSSGEVQLDSLIEKLEREAQAAREDRRRAAEAAEAARLENLRLKEIVRRAEEERREAVQKAKEKASTIISSLRFKLRELDEMSKKAEKADKTEVRRKAEEIQALEAQLKVEEIVGAKPLKAVDINLLNPGDTVRVYKYKKTGKVLSVKKEKGQVVVQLDTMKVTLGPDELEPATKAAAQPKQAAPVTVTRADEEESGGIELNIIGQRYEEAEEKVQRFLDQCLLSGIGQVRIIHGRGTGALRKMVSDTLRRYPGVKGFHYEAFEAGGDAVTVVEFR